MLCRDSLLFECWAFAIGPFVIVYKAAAFFWCRLVQKNPSSLFPSFSSICYLPVKITLISVSYTLPNDIMQKSPLVYRMLFEVAIGYPSVKGESRNNLFPRTQQLCRDLTEKIGLMGIKTSIDPQISSEFDDDSDSWQFQLPRNEILLCG